MQLLRTAVALSISTLILFGSACSSEHRAAKFYMVNLATAKGCLSDDRREVVATAIGKHRARLNIEPDATIPEVGRRLREVMKTRVGKVVWVKADQSTPWGEFMELVAQVWPEVNFVSLITPEVDALSFRNDCLTVTCQGCKMARAGFRAH